MTDNRDSLEAWTKEACHSAEQHGSLLIATRHSATGDTDQEPVLVMRGREQVSLCVRGETLVLNAVELRAALRRP